MTVSDLPHLNAGFNAASAVLLAAGYVCVRAGRVAAHKACMAAAMGTSALFLGSYLFYHYHAGSVRFQGTGSIRTVYLGILFSHSALAALVAPLALRLAFLGWRDRVPEHRRLGRWVLPAWLYVSVTGVVVYAMLYRMTWA